MRKLVLASQVDIFWNRQCLLILNGRYVTNDLESIFLNHFQYQGRLLKKKRNIWFSAFQNLGSRVTHDSFNQYLLFLSKQCIYCKTNAIYT